MRTLLYRFEPTLSKHNSGDRSGITDQLSTGGFENPDLSFFEADAKRSCPQRSERCKCLSQNRKKRFSTAGNGPYYYY